MGKKAEKDTIIDITSDSKMNSNFPCRRSPDNLTFNNYFYLFLYLYITEITINNNASVLMLSLLDDNQFEVIEAFNSTLWYLDDLLNIDDKFLTAWSIILTLQNFS